MAIPWSTVLTTVIGILISVFTGYLSLKVRQLDQKNQAYRKEREAKEEAEQAKRELEHQSLSKLTLGMARSMLLDNYYRCADKGWYSATQRDVYHALFDAYVKAGGNSVIIQLADKITELPTEPPKSHDD